MRVKETYILHSWSMQAGGSSQLKSEYGVDANLEAMPYQLARWISDGWQSH